MAIPVLGAVLRGLASLGRVAFSSTGSLIRGTQRLGGIGQQLQPKAPSILRSLGQSFLPISGAREYSGQRGRFFELQAQIAKTTKELAQAQGGPTTSSNKAKIARLQERLNHEQEELARTTKKTEESIQSLGRGALALGAGVGAMAFGIRRIARVDEERANNLAQFNAGIAQSLAVLERDRIIRSQVRGQATSLSSQKMLNQLNRFEEAWGAGPGQAFENFKNKVATGFLVWGEDIADWLQSISINNWKPFGKEPPKPPGPQNLPLAMQLLDQMAQGRLESGTFTGRMKPQRTPLPRL